MAGCAKQSLSDYMATIPENCQIVIETTYSTTNKNPVRIDYLCARCPGTKDDCYSFGPKHYDPPVCNETLGSGVHQFQEACRKERILR